MVPLIVLVPAVLAAATLDDPPAVPPSDRPAESAPAPAPANGDSGLPLPPPLPAPDPAAPSTVLPNYDELAATYRPALARAYLREVGMLLNSEAVTPSDFEIALFLANQALQWIPDEPNAWRVALDLGRVARQAPGGAELESRAIQALSRLDPDDEVIRLLRLVEAVEAAETAEGRLAGYDRLLAPAVRQQLGPRISSRLMFEKALLLSRMGDIDGFASALAEAVTLDPAFPAATEMAAGFLASRLNDPGAVAELLIAAIVANPTSVSIYLDLGALLMAEGAYPSAERIFRLAEAAAVNKDFEVKCDIITDIALAQWGAGDPSRALATLRTRMERFDQDLRRVMARVNPSLGMKELNKSFSVLPPTISTLAAVLAHELDDPSAASMLERMEASFQALIDQMEKDATERQALAATLLNRLWATLLLNVEVDKAPARLERAERAAALSDEARRRFEGWIAFRRGDLAGAIEMLRPLAETDAMARLGLGLALVAHQEVRDGAKELLAVARAERGTALGIYAAARLAELVKAPLGPGPGAAALEAAVAALPTGFDRVIQDSRSALALTIVPERRTYAAFEQIRFRITLVNRTNMTLAIDPIGPIDPRSAISLTMSAVGAGSAQLPTLLLPIDRRLELGPRESMSLTVDLSLLPYGALVWMNALRGLSIELRCVTNFVPMDPRVSPGFFGVEGHSGLVRVDGVRLDDAWNERTWKELERTGLVLDPRDFALMAASLTLQEDVRDRSLMLRLQNNWAQLARAFEKYPPVVQAWLLMILANTTLADGPFLEVARASPDSGVVGAYMLRRARDPADPVFDAARRRDDPYLHLLADSVQKAIARRVEEMQRAFGIVEDQRPPSR